MASNPELEARLVANPDDTDGFRVYADWLQAEGDPRGELVAVQVELAQRADASLAAREQELLAAHGAEWLGGLAGVDPKKDLAVTWRNGFVRAVRIGPPVEAYKTSELDFVDAIAKLAALPGLAFVDELVIGAVEEADSPRAWSGCVQALATHGAPPNLRALTFTRGGYWDISWTDLGDLSASYPRLSRLQELRIELGHMQFGKLALPELRSITIVTGGLERANLASFRDAAWPKLEKLSLCIGETGNDYGCDVEMGDLAWIFDAQNLAGVRHLGLANSSLANEIARALVGSRILRQLETLDLSQGWFDDEGAERLLEDPGFARLRSIDLSRSYVSAELRGRLATLGPQMIFDDPQEAEDPDDRYCAISE
jgi:uncharacterized protein (TIGR02996 family)